MQRKQVKAEKRKAAMVANCGPRLKPKRVVAVRVKMRGADGSEDRGSEPGVGYIRFQ